MAYLVFRSPTVAEAHWVELDDEMGTSLCEQAQMQLPLLTYPISEKPFLSDLLAIVRNRKGLVHPKHADWDRLEDFLKLCIRMTAQTTIEWLDGVDDGSLWDEEEQEDVYLYCNDVASQGVLHMVA